MTTRTFGASYGYLCTGRAQLSKIGNDATQLFVEHGFRLTRASTCIMHYTDRDFLLLVHGDDFVSVGDEQEVAWLQQVLESNADISTVVVGPGESKVKPSNILDRIISASVDGNTYEPEVRHAELIARN